MKSPKHALESGIQPCMAAFALSAVFVAAMGSGDAAVSASGDQMTATKPAAGGQSHDDLAKKLANPIAAMISVPFQNNFDWGGGPNGDGFMWKMNIQPVIPFKLNDEWNLITRTIVPVISQNDVAGTRFNPSGTQTGLGDTLFASWFSPAEATKSGWIWGVGPALMIPTGSDDMLTGNQWGAGPTAIALKQQGKLTYGALLTQVWEFAGRGGRSRLNLTTMQPFFAYVPGGGWTYSINTESSFDWTGNQWTVPINLMVSKMFKIGKTPAQWQVGARYYAEKPDNGPEWGLRLSLTLLYPQ